MYTLLLILLILDAIVLTVVVLLQVGQGGGLAALGGSASTDSFFGGRQAVTILTKMSWICGGAFLGIALILAGLSSRTAAPRSVLEEGIQPPAPVAPIPLDVGRPDAAGNQSTPATPVPDGNQ